MYIRHEMPMTFHMVMVLTILALLNALVTLASPAGREAWNRVSSANPVHDTDRLIGIRVSGDDDEHDDTFLQESLTFLYEDAPYWYAYIAQARPFELVVDLEAGNRGISAFSTCCSADGYADITLGNHIADRSLPRLSASSTLEEQRAVGSHRLAFLSTLIREATRVIEFRAGRTASPWSERTCLESERTAVTREIEFRRSLIGTSRSSTAATRRQINREALREQVKAEAMALESGSLESHCRPLLMAHSE